MRLMDAFRRSLSFATFSSDTVPGADRQAVRSSQFARAAARVRELALGGVDAVFDHVGGRSIVDSWCLLAPGGALISYGSASTRDDQGSKQWPVLKLLGRVWLWNALPNRRRAYFFNVWAGRTLSRNRFRARLRADLTEVFEALGRGEITAQIAAELPLTRVAEAMRLAESGTVAGKVVLRA